jgi:hypothetical protein
MLIGYVLIEREEEIAKLGKQKKDALGASPRKKHGQEVINQLRAESKLTPL